MATQFPTLVAVEQPVCEVCGLAHATDKHDELDKRPYCWNCGNHHEAGKCPKVEDRRAILGDGIMTPHF